MEHATSLFTKDCCDTTTDICFSYTYVDDEIDVRKSHGRTRDSVPTQKCGYRNTTTPRVPKSVTLPIESIDLRLHREQNMRYKKAQSPLET